MSGLSQKPVYRAAILTISDAGAKGERVDTSGDVISERVAALGFQEMAREIVPDERDQIAQKIAAWADGGNVDIVISTGGTGLGPRDVTPEAVRAVFDYEVPGIGEAMRAGTLTYTQMAMLSRAVAGVRKGCLVITLPGSPKAVRECLEVVEPVIPHALEILHGQRGHPPR
ncbi:MAG: MogA/MoaB family molybdenum cofactor biosynthesis protein [SAR202 cluster bacterium]|nr:MogA/MoaB family molybdenum cofactor biosynthesis protein [SAR202 cluster bacterium]